MCGLIVLLQHNALDDIKKVILSTRGDNLVIIKHDTSRDSVINLTMYIGSGNKKELRCGELCRRYMRGSWSHTHLLCCSRTRSFSNIGGKAKSSLLAGARQSVQLSGNVQNDNNAASQDPMLGDAVVGDDEAERVSEFVSQVGLCHDWGVVADL